MHRAFELELELELAASQLLYHSGRLVKSQDLPGTTCSSVFEDFFSSKERPPTNYTFYQDNTLIERCTTTYNIL